jgi:hypothetical protein
MHAVIGMASKPGFAKPGVAAPGPIQAQIQEQVLRAPKSRYNRRVGR